MPETVVLGPADGSLRLHTTRTGAAARMGHDLIIEVTRWSATLTADQSGSGLASVSASAEAGSCEVIEGSGGAKPLTGKDKLDIKKTIEDKVLLVGRHPQITFEANAVDGATVRGQLSLTGSTRPWELAYEVVGDRIKARGSIVQSEFGVKLYSGLLGALKVGDVVAVSIDIRNPRA